MNQGGNVHAVASPNPNPVVANQMFGEADVYAAYYSSVPGHEATAWASQKEDNGSAGTVIPPNTNYSYAQPTETQQKTVQDILNSASQNSWGLGVSVPQEYTSYPPHQTSSDPNGCSNTAHQSYYNSYQHQPSHAYSQPVGAYQNSGAPYQPISSFQNTGSYAEPASYSSTYYNPGGYQTSSGGYHNQTTAGGYLTSSYNNQMNLWNGVNHSNYSSQQQSYYAPDSNSAYSSTSTASTTVQYQQQCAQWADYYNQTEVSCAPGTEPSTKTATPNTGYAVPGVSSVYSTTGSQQSQPAIPPCRLEPSSTELTASQV